MLKPCVIVFLIALALTSCTTIPQNDQFKISHQVLDNLKGNITVDKAFIDNDELCNLYFERFVQNGKRLFAIEVTYNGRDWLFIKEATISVDGNIYEVTDNNPHREVLDNGSVSEDVMFFLPDESIPKLSTVNNLKIQYFGEPVVIPLQGINLIHQIILISGDFKS
jgi:hypothetical protein